VTEPRKRYQVFVSSTYVDLVAERQRVLEVLLQLGHIPAGMELFPASNEEIWPLIQRVIAECDYYIVVVGGRYGSADPDSGLGYTEREYDFAVSNNKPVLGFVHGDPGSIALDKSELEGPARERLQAFREKVLTRMCKSWHNPEELASSVILSLTQEIERNPGVGWIKADRAFTPELQAEMADLKARLMVAEKAESGPPREIDESLLQGTDPASLGFEYENLASNTIRSVWSTTWGRIFAVVGPHLLTEETEAAMAQALAEVAFESISVVGYSARLIPADFQVVKVQLFSLNLIQRTSKGMWVLTQQGEDELMRAVALRRQ
jgi:Domain of unknown function (DUF4062)